MAYDPYTKCKREECERRVFASSLCSQHYVESLYDGEWHILDEEENMCSNPLCATTIPQARTEYGLLDKGPRKEYCKRCERQARSHDPLPGLDDWEPMECAECLVMGDAIYIRSNQGVCQKCTARKRKARQCLKNQQSTTSNVS